MNNLVNVLENFKNNNLKNELQNSLREKQEKFLQSKLGQIVNNAIDFGIKAVLPDWLEDEIIEIKDSILNDGFKEGVKLAVDKAINVGKSIEGIFTGNFESISQIKSVIKNGGLLDTISNLLDDVILWAKDEKIISASTAKLIRTNKKIILDNVENSIKNDLENQSLSIEKINGYMEKWDEYFSKSDFTNMKKTYNKIQKEMKEIVPLQSIFNKYEEITNIQKLLENNGEKFDLTNTDLELAKILI